MFSCGFFCGTSLTFLCCKAKMRGFPVLLPSPPSPQELGSDFRRKIMLETLEKNLVFLFPSSRVTPENVLGIERAEGRPTTEGRRTRAEKAGPAPRSPRGCSSTHARDRPPRGPRQPAPGQQPAEHNGSRLEPQVSTNSWGSRGPSPHTHSCIERLQYSMCRGVPFRLNWTTV